MRHSAWSGGREVHDWKLVLRQRTPDLLVELLSRQRAVIVRDQQESAFEQVLAQPLDFDVGEPRRPRVLHQRERTLKQPIIGQTDDDRIGNPLSAFVRELDADLGQFGEADAEIDVRPRVIGAPTLFFAPVARKQDAAEVEAAIVGRGGRKPRRRSAVEPGPDALRMRRGDGDGDDAKSDD